LVLNDYRPELNIKPWGQMVMHMRKGNSMKNWTARKPLAYWKGNLRTGERKKLAKCGSIKDWNAEIIHLVINSSFTFLKAQVFTW